VDKDVYSNLTLSHSGGTLALSNVLIVSNENLPKDILDEWVRKEEADVSTLNLLDSLDREKILDAGNSLIGPFTHIINILYAEDNNGYLKEDGKYNIDEQMYKIYQWHQEEVDYLVCNGLDATICTVFIDDMTDGHFSIGNNVAMMIRGLAEALANHRIICNGIVADREVSLRLLLDSTAFLSSKYGQIMTGEILRMRK